MNDISIAEYIVSMGLSLSLSVYLAFRAGRRVRGLTHENAEEKLADFAFDSLKELISNKLETLFGLQGVQLPAGLSIQDIGAHLHFDNENLVLLQTIYDSLVELSIQSPYYVEAAAYVLQFGG